MANKTHLEVAVCVLRSALIPSKERGGDVLVNPIGSPSLAELRGGSQTCGTLKRALQDM